MMAPTDVIFLVDVDNTLFDNDRFIADLTARLDRDFGSSERERYWSIFGMLRNSLGYADYLGALQQFRADSSNEEKLLHLSTYLLDYPFKEHLYEHVFKIIEHLGTFGNPVILSDGDIVFQPCKIHRSGLWDAFSGRVLVYVHKEEMLDDVQKRYPAKHYVMVDDKPFLLAKMKQKMASMLTTVFVRQGHYAEESAGKLIEPFPDVVIDRIGDLQDVVHDSDGRIRYGNSGLPHLKKE
jgi:FMN phosphatase YigB (HAD superfamily)